MDSRLPVDFDPSQVSLFLQKIARDRDAELHEISQKRDAEIARIRAEAHAESRRLFGHGAERLRARLELQRSRYLARVRSELRRRQWEILNASQQRVLRAVFERFHHAWQDPPRQWGWCRCWLALALERAGDNAIRVVLGEGALEEVRTRVERAIRDFPAGGSVNIDANADPGIFIEWGDFLLDGRLASQTVAVTDALLGRLSSLLYESGSESVR